LKEQAFSLEHLFFPYQSLGELSKTHLQNTVKESNPSRTLTEVFGLTALSLMASSTNPAVFSGDPAPGLTRIIFLPVKFFLK
jgi:hypothetical protein